MTKIVCLNDVHYTRNAPECRSDSYPLEILEKLHEVRRIADRIGADAIACTGDWFHRKGRVTHREANDLLAVLRGWGDKNYAALGILGNHDIAGHALESLDRRAVGALVHSRVLHLLDGDPWWDPSEDQSAVVTGTSYFHGCDADDDARVKMYGARVEIDEPRGSTVHVHLAHGTLLQKGEFFNDYTTAPELIDLLAENDCLPDVIVCGHLHYDEGIKLYRNPLRPSRKVAVCRVGSIGRVAADDLERIPNALVIAIRGGRFVCKAIPIGKPIERGEVVEGREDPAEHEERIRSFVKSLREESDAWEVADHQKLIREIVDRMGHDEEIYKLAFEAVERRQ